jgi:chromate transporter
MVSEQLLASGYGITQAMPGPLFSVAALLGAASSVAVSPSPLLAIGYGLWALWMMFLPAWLLVLAAMPYWQQLRRHAWLQRMLQAVNAAVVGLLLVAWLSLWPMALALTAPFAQPIALVLSVLASIVLAAAWLLQRRLVPVWLLVLGFALAFSLGFAQIECWMRPL